MNIDNAIICLKDIPVIHCSEFSNRKIDEALSFLFVAKDHL